MFVVKRFYAQIDHTTGLMMLREHGRPLEVYCTSMVYQDLTGGYPLFRVLEYYCGVEWHAVPVDGEPFTIPEIGGLRFTAIPLRSEAPPYSPHRHAPHRDLLRIFKFVFPTPCPTALLLPQPPGPAQS